MSDQIELLEDETVVAELATSGEYIKHRNQVACVTDQRIVFLKKRTVGAYYTIEYLPLSACTQIAYRKTLAIGAMIGGAILALVGGLVFLFAVTGQFSNFNAVVYGIPLIAIGGALVFGVKRHMLVFQCGDRLLRWVSSAGGFEKRFSVLRTLRDYAHQRGIVVADFTI